jgi:tryptophan halogenase
MMGQGITPRTYHPITEKLSDQELAHFLSTIRDSVTRTVKSLPEHAAYVSQYCGTARAAAA